MCSGTINIIIMTAGARQGRYRDQFLSSDQLRDNQDDLASSMYSIATYIEQCEAIERIKHHPHLTEPAPNVEIDDVLAEEKIQKKSAAGNNNSNSNISLRHLNLKEFSLQLLVTHHHNHNLNLSSSPSSSSTLNYINITELDVSNNELSQLPGLSTLSSLQTLNLSRNWFNALPADIGKLTLLKEINASRNFLKPNSDSLLFDQIKTLEHLEVLDVSLNQKCRTVDHRTFIKKSIARPATTYGGGATREQVEVRVTIWQEMFNSSSDGNKNNNCIGASAAVRDPSLLRSQLEPWGTVNLRRRLVCDFGQEPTHPKLIDRAGVMERLLKCYLNEGLLHIVNNKEEDEDDDVTALNNGVGQRPTVAIKGGPVRQDLLDEILLELRDWRYNSKRGGSSNNRERPTIKADCYMILCAPPPETTTSPDGSTEEEGGTVISRRAKRRNKKMDGNRKLWNLAIQAMKEQDPEFATRCSEIAVTYGFIGSPHM